MPLLLPSFRRQQRVLDFSHVERHHVEGVYVTLSPDSPADWVGVLFVRDGPYESAILRFTIHFPDDFPDVAPVITFSTDVFHPLVVPLTQYTFSAGTLDASTSASASDDARLPPGAFNLRHVFPGWFTRDQIVGSGQNADLNRGSSENHTQDPCATSATAENIADSSQTAINILKHLKEAFENASVLDNVEFGAVGNPSAWHAWRAYRGLSTTQTRGRSPSRSQEPERSPSSPKQMSDWNWEGVWESRVRNAVETSISEAGLFSNQSLVKFAKIDASQLKEIRQQIQTS
ncbi:uncharacterized protein AB675_1523 [Cyphellophora attinorum]|uniref:UBC core domain-containing protein n=1 Tax=Cyphellophora attinorum TaxID=1664694 RepID=A0A0N1HPP5_9EURO|nr:uncharacterized protein AB675_1523 [Phialophora attinorum]KPI37260.1 hypothetical protein AB675_1523 [Phialophora attinorum]